MVPRQRHARDRGDTGRGAKGAGLHSLLRADRVDSKGVVMN